MNAPSAIQRRPPAVGLAVSLLLALAPARLAGELVYTNDFAVGPGPEWSPAWRTSTATAGYGRFLGEFDNRTVSLTLTGLVAHTEITVEFDLFILWTMDGNGDVDHDSVNLWRLSVEGGATLVNATFMNSFPIMKNSVQSYPDDYGAGVHEGRTGAVQNNTLGRRWNGWALDSVYHLAYTFEHASETLTLEFAGAGLQGLEDEGWGLDNVAVYAGPTTPVISYGPTAQYAAVGEDAAFSVRAAGGRDLAYRWLHAGTPIPGATNATLTLPAVQLTNAGLYRVEIRSAADATLSPPAPLTVFPARPPKLWECPAPGPIAAPPAVGRDGTVYCGSGDGTLLAIDRAGSNLWSYTVAGPLVGAPAVGPSGRVYFGARDNRITAVNPDGSLAWSYEAGTSIDGGPALGPDETVYVGGADGRLFCLRSRGVIRWSRETSSWVHSSPAIGTNGVIYAGSADGGLYAWTPIGQRLWAFTTDGPIGGSPGLGADGTIYVGSSAGRLHAVSPDGAPQWTFGTGGGVDSSPAVGPDGTLYVGSGDRTLYALTPDGRKKWAFAMSVPVASSPAIGADGTIFIGPVGGRVLALDPAGKVKWAVDVGPGVFGASPLLTIDGRLIVGGGNRLHAFAVGTGPAASAWPMFRRDPHHAANAGSPLAFPGRLTAPVLAADAGAEMILEAETGVTYAVKASPDLNQWSVLTNVTPATVEVRVTDPDAGRHERRFYRAVGP